MEFQTEQYYDGILRKTCTRKKRIPAWVYGVTDGRNWNRAAIADDVDRVIEVERELQRVDSSPKKIQWGELHRNGYHYGISYLHQFYTARNYLVIRKLWDAADNYTSSIRDAIRLLLLKSYDEAYSSILCIE